MKNQYQEHFKKLSKQKDKPSSRLALLKQKTKKNNSLAKRKRKKNKFEMKWSIIVLLLIMSTISGAYVYNENVFEGYIRKIKFNFGTQAGAVDKEKPKSTKGEENSSATKGNKAEDNAGEKNKNGDLNAASLRNWTDEELSHFSKLKVRKLQLDKREEQLGKLEEELHKQKLEIEGRIKKLEKLRGQISRVLKERVDVDQAKVKKLVEFYSNMKPQQAAKIIETIDEDLAVEILGQMKKKNAASIMNLLNSGKAQILSEKFAGYKR